MPNPPLTETAVPPVATADKPDDHVPMLVKQLFDSGITEDKPPGNADQDPDKPENLVPPKKPAAAPLKKADAPADKPVETPDDKPITRRQQALQRPTFKFEEPVKPKAEVATPVEPSKPDPKWEATLEENEREMLGDARYLEERFPDKYRGYGARTEKFLREHAKYVQEQGEDFDETSAEYKAFLDKNQPRLSRAEIREIEATRVADRVNKDWQGKHADLQHKLFVRDEEPKVDREAQQVWADLANTALPEEVANAIKKDGFEKASKEYAIEVETAQAVLTAATQDIKEFLRINRKDPETRRPLATLATEPGNTEESQARYAQHIRLGQMVADICDDFKKTAPTDQQFKNGKWFVTRDEFNRLTPESRRQAWSFTNPEIVERMKGVAKSAVANAIKQKLEYLDGRGFKRQPSVVIKPDERKVEQTRRTAAPSPAPGSSDAPPTIDPQVTTLMGLLHKE